MRRLPRVLPALSLLLLVVPLPPWPHRLGGDGAGRPAGRPYTSGAGMGIRICRR
jgi:hypothetical protein